MGWAAHYRWRHDLCPHLNLEAIRGPRKAPAIVGVLGQQHRGGGGVVAQPLAAANSEASKNSPIPSAAKSPGNGRGEPRASSPSTRWIAVSCA